MLEGIKKELYTTKPFLSYDDLEDEANLNEVALKNINLTINCGECLAIVGPSGAGKKQLFNKYDLSFYIPS